MHKISNDEILQKLINAKQRGVNVKIVTNDDIVFIKNKDIYPDVKIKNEVAKIDKLQSAGIPVI